jgi:cob(I)alamin adenosyltransferase
VKIYTRTGDAGETALFDGTRVSKADPRVAAYGDIDELNSVLGVVRASGVDARIAEVILEVQQDLHAIGARLADPRRRIAERVEKAQVSADSVTRLEEHIDAFELELPPLRHFILPGGSTPAASLHLARAVCRRAERQIAALGPDATEPTVLTYVNRVSDLLFVLARVANHRAGVAETEW